MTDTWTLDASDGELTVRTGVAGPAARMGHRLNLAVTRWHATVKWIGSQPNTAEVVVEVDSLRVLSGEGGVKGLSGPEKAIARSNALKSLSAKNFPQISFTAEVIEPSEQGYRLTGTLAIRGKQRTQVVDLRTEDLGDSWRMTAESKVRQSDYRVKRFSMLMGALQVADEVTVSFTAVRPKGE